MHRFFFFLVGSFFSVRCTSKRKIRGVHLILIFVQGVEIYLFLGLICIFRPFKKQIRLLFFIVFKDQGKMHLGVKFQNFKMNFKNCPHAIQ